MQIYPVLLLSFISRLPETPRWFIFNDRGDDAKGALTEIYGEDEMQEKYEELVEAHEKESSQSVGYSDMIFPSGSQFHPTMVTVMGQVNQALTGYGAVSVYGPQIFELLGLGVQESEFLTMGNYVSYFFLMTFAWLYIDVVGRRLLMVAGALGLSGCFLILTLLGGLAQNADQLGIPDLPLAVVGGITLYIATGAFGIGWLSEVWLIPTEIYPSSSRAQGAAISVVIWGLANFAVTLLTPIGFNNLSYWLFLVFAATNGFAAWWTWVSQSPGTSMPVADTFLTGLFPRDGWTLVRSESTIFRRCERAQYVAGHQSQQGRVQGYAEERERRSGWRVTATVGQWVLILTKAEMNIDLSLLISCRTYRDRSSSLRS